MKFTQAALNDLCMLIFTGAKAHGIDVDLLRHAVLKQIEGTDHPGAESPLHGIFKQAVEHGAAEET